MKPFALVILLVASTYGMNPYGTVRVSYGAEMPAANPISYSKMPDAYNAPAPSYQAPAAPAYQAPAAPAYQAPAYQAPAAPAYQAPAYQASAPAYGSGYGSAAPQAPAIAIVRYNAAFHEDNSASHDYLTAHGVSHQEATNVRYQAARGTPEDPMAGAAMLTKTGSFSYQSPEGRTISLNYVADENGFRATGDHLPTPPPIPAEIQKSLEMIRSASAGGSSYGYSQSAPASYGGYSAPAPAPAYGGYSAPAPAPAPAYGGYSAPAPAPAYGGYSAPAPAPAKSYGGSSY